MITLLLCRGQLSLDIAMFFFFLKHSYLKRLFKVGTNPGHLFELDHSGLVSRVGILLIAGLVLVKVSLSKTLNPKLLLLVTPAPSW